MIRRPPRSTPLYSSAASDVYKRQVNVLGLTFKENCPDLRNTKVINIIKELKDYGLDVHVNDVEADKEEAQRFYNINLEDKNELPQADAIVFAVAHKDYVDNKQDYLKLVKDNGVVLDIKGVIEENEIGNKGLWRL